MIPKRWMIWEQAYVEEPNGRIDEIPISATCLADARARAPCAKRMVQNQSIGFHSIGATVSREATG